MTPPRCACCCALARIRIGRIPRAAARATMPSSTGRAARWRKRSTTMRDRRPSVKAHPAMVLPSDPAADAGLTLDEVRARLAPLVADAAAFDGWSEAALDDAAERGGIASALARLAFKDGAMAMIAAWIDTIDAAMEQALPPEKLAAMKVRERLSALLEY